MAKLTYLHSYNGEVEGTVSDCAKGLGVSTSMVYIALKNSPHEIDPVGKYRTGLKGKGSKIYKYSDIEEMYNQWLDAKGSSDNGDFVSEYDKEVYCTLDEYSDLPNVNYTKSQVYVRVKDQGLNPEFKHRPSGRGRGSSIYKKEDVANAVKVYEEAKANECSDTYDSSVYASSDDVLSMFPDEWEVTKAMVYPLLRLFNLQVVCQYRRSAKGKPTNLYNRAEVAQVIECAGRCRYRG